VRILEKEKRRQRQDCDKVNFKHVGVQNIIESTLCVQDILTESILCVQDILQEPNGRSKGCAIVEYTTAHDAQVECLGLRVEG
jgi:hypothetical protein